MSILHLSNISRRFGSILALNGVDFDMPEGSLQAIIGPNGAGKTTLFNLITGFFPPSDGEVMFDGRNINDLDAVERVNQGIARTFQITEIFPELGVYENLRVAVEACEGMSRRPWLRRAQRRALDERVDELMSQMGLTAKAERLVSELSHGDQRVVEVAMALALRPRLLLLDEPTAGMGNQETDHMVDLIDKLHRDHRQSILFIEHDMDIVFGIAERITVLDQGTVIATGDAEAISNDARVKAAYLGEAA